MLSTRTTKPDSVLDTLEVMDGGLPVRQMRLVREWAALHAAELADNWEIAEKMNGSFKRIEPLP
jgi:hypothetical protein